MIRTINFWFFKRARVLASTQILINKSGSFAIARSELKQNPIRALYGLKNTVNKSKPSDRLLHSLTV